LDVTWVEAGTAVKQFSPFHWRAGRIGRELNPPPQFGQVNVQLCEILRGTYSP
jgi:hypothetical protein